MTALMKPFFLELEEMEDQLGLLNANRINKRSYDNKPNQRLNFG